MTSTINDQITEAFGADDWARTHRPALEASNLPPAVFHSPAVYEQELKNIFHSQWICLGQVADFDDEGAELVRFIDTEEVRLTRAHDGTISASQKVEVWNGFLFVNFDATATPLSDDLSETYKWGAENYALHDERSVHRFEWDCPANWKLLVENFVEEYHVAWVHADSFQPTMPMKRWESHPEMTTQPWSHMFGDFHETSMSVEGPALFPLIETLTERERGGMAIVTIYPNLMLILAVDCLIYYYVLPTGVDSCKVVAHLCVPSAVAQRVKDGEPELLRAVEEYVENTKLILDEDMEASDRQSAGLRSRFAKAGRVCRHELLLSSFHHWLLDTAYAPVLKK
jgi:phenylpropionate dioxygenase-like ring-hydroxylating dioxygenase large terminal subunit